MPAGGAPPDEDAAGSAPLPLRWVEELVNTRNVEDDTDEIATADALADWLRARRLLPAGASVTAAAHRRAVRVREGLRALIAANNPEPAAHPAGERQHPDGVDPEALADLAGLAHDLPLVLDVTGRPPRLVPRDPESVDVALARLLAAVAEAVADGTLDRLKACREPGCRWAYYDHSRNRSRAWCSMAVCGNRAKARAFRRRVR
ncbi:MAG: hypothetical protein GEV03_28950 [Streptosporangiales bacterium]|nr:hypothetical protein [Streptosporangiales bacterium]